MAGLFVLFCLFLLVAVFFMHYRHERINIPKKFPRKVLLLGHDFSKGSHWYPSPVTKGTGEKLLKAVGESHDQDASEKILRPRTDKSVGKKTKGTSEKLLKAVGESHDQDASEKILRPRTDKSVGKKTKGTSEKLLKAVGESHDQDALEKIFRPRTDEGIEKKDIGTIVVEDNNPTDEDVEKKEVVAIIVEDDSPTDEDVEKDVGEKMTYTKFQKLLLLADSMIASCALKKAEYGRGYQMGIQIHFNNTQPGSLPDNHSIAEIARTNGCRNVHAFARGYNDGYMGLKPEYTG